MTGRYDAIVAGLGAMGSAAVAHIARRGFHVLGLDAFHRGHALGSSHGTSRIIREAYFEDPRYVPLVQRAYTLWRELEVQCGRSLLTMTGGLYLGRPDSVFVAGAIRSAGTHGLQCDVLTAEDVHERFPGLAVPDGMMGVWEANAGLLQPEHCVAAYLDLSARYGAEIHHREPVVAYRCEGDSVTVTTLGARYQADRLIIATGPWSSELLADLQLPLTVKRVVNVHFESARPDLFDRVRFPVCLLDVPEGRYYAVPGGRGDWLKLGRHDGGVICTPHTIDREVSAEEIGALRAVADTYMAGASGPLVRACTCMYTLTPDEHFVVDRHPAHQQVIIACGFSGHGFKFASVIGETLAELALDGASRNDVAFLGASRFIQ
jgi:sarcosine oxidase